MSVFDVGEEEDPRVAAARQIQSQQRAAINEAEAKRQKAIAGAEHAGIAGVLSGIGDSLSMVPYAGPILNAAFQAASVGTQVAGQYADQPMDETGETAKALGTWSAVGKGAAAIGQDIQNEYGGEKPPKTTPETTPEPQAGGGPVPLHGGGDDPLGAFRGRVGRRTV